MDKLSRRDLLKVASMAGAAATVPMARSEALPAQAAVQQDQGQNAQAPGGKQSEHGQGHEVLFFFNEEEAKFIRAAVDRLIPGDDQWGGAEKAGVLFYIDRQLAGAYGSGARMYLDGPWDPDAPPQQGYQLRHSPAELYRIGIAEARGYIRGAQNGQEFSDLSPDAMDSVLKDLESGNIELPSVPAPVFFETLLANTIEGYFSDPAYGGNRDMVSWRMIGFPGAYAQYVGLVDQYDFNFAREPISLATSATQLAQHHHD